MSWLIGKIGFSTPLVMPSIPWYCAYLADDLTATLSNGDPVSSWVPFSYTNYHVLTQATSGKRPTFVASGVGGRAAIQGDGIDDRLGDDTFGLIAQPYTIVAIGSMVTHATTGVFPSLASGGQTGSSATIAGLLYRNGANFRIYAGTDGPSVAGDASHHAFRCYFDGSSSELQVGTTVDTSGTVGTKDLAGMNVLGVPTQSDEFNAGQIAFLGVYDGDVTLEPNWATFRAWVTAYYGLTF